MPKSVILRQTIRTYGNYDRSRPPFKVIQGHWNPQGSIRYV